MLTAATKLLRFLLTHPVSKRHPFRYVIRFIYWQVRLRVSRTPLVFDFVDGARMYVQKRMTGTTGNLYVGLHEYEDMAFVLHFVQPGDLVLDVGANVGSYTILAGAARKAEVIAIEPSEEARNWLQRNARLNAMENRLTIRSEAVGAQTSVARFSKGLDTVNRVLREDEDNLPAQMVDMISIDELLDGRAPILVKMDVEGFETEALSGASHTLSDQRLKCVLMELNGAGAQYGHSDAAIVETMAGYGFLPYQYEPANRALQKRKGDNRAPNMLFLRDLIEIKERVRNGDAFALHGMTI